MIMPTYEILIDGKPQKIEITRNNERSFTVKVNDKSISVELQTDKADLQERFPIRIADKTYQVHVPKTDLAKTFQIEVEEAAFKAEVKTSPQKTALTVSEPALITPTRRIAKNQFAEGSVTAPMTGKIVSVKAKKGDQVKANQVLCIIEAMKMENEINASKAGVIKEVNVSEGSPVNEGDVLFVIG
jgi:biotin carboxyl carrier protein